MHFGKSYWRTFEEGLKREWLLTNGIGGFSSGTIIGANARRYHGLLMASLKPPVERHLVLSQISECVQVAGRAHFLHAFKTTNFTAHGEYYLESFTYDCIPTWHYRVEDINIEKSVSMVYGQNKAVVLYRIYNGSRKSVLKLTPIVNFRNYHYTSSSPYMQFSVDSDGRNMEITPYKLNCKIKLTCNEGELVLSNECYFFNMEYEYERERGLDSVEDHFMPGFYEINLMPGEKKEITFIASFDEEIDNSNGIKLIQEEKDRQMQLTGNDAGLDEFYQSLIRAADKFIVYRKSTNSKTIIAGYPWFTDWGRDTMIALPGLTLVTGRYNDARDILYSFSIFEKDGLLPNVFPDGDNDPAYNTVDASLWFFQAIQKYLDYTEDIEFVKEKLYPVMKNIINGYKVGTHYSIEMENDYLITAGNQTTQLTWMDAKVGDWVVTPRHGKAVEINALWYNALMVMSQLSEKIDEDPKEYMNMAKKVKESFINVFWNETNNCLFDVVGTGFKDNKIRPNQIIAVSLAFPVVEGEKAKGIVDVVWRELYTALGLRSISMKYEQYRGLYFGDQYARDGAYHQGTVWTWPLGQFITAWARVYGKENKDLLYMFYKPFKDHLKDAGLENISEIFDGNEPLIPRGCFAQAWSVAEILRSYWEDYLSN